MKNSKESSQLKNLILAKLAKEDFLAYAMMVNKKYNVAPIHRIFGDMVERVKKTLLTEGATLNLIVTVPPRHGKSHTFSELMVSWLMGSLPALEVIFVTHTQSFAEKIGSTLRDIFFSKQYKAIMQGEAVLRADAKSKSNMQLVNGSVWKGVGANGNITGYGANIIIADDLIKSRADAESKNTRKNIFTYFQQTLGSRQQPYQPDNKKLGKVKIVIMQRWHQDDPVGKLLEEQAKHELQNPDGNFEKWEVINFEAIATEDQYYNGELFRLKGEPLWEDMFPLSELGKIKSRSLYSWASQYQQDPILSELQIFKESYFKYYDEEDLKDKKLDYYTLLDPAISQEDDADNTVILTVAKERYGHKIYRIREDAGKFTPNETVDYLFEHYDEYGGKVVIEQIQWQKGLAYIVKDEQVRRGIRFKIHETKRGNKEARIGVGLLSLYEQGIVYHRKGSLDSEYEMELLEFPRGKRDDRADVMSFILDAVKKTESMRQAQIIQTKIKSYIKKRF